MKVLSVASECAPLVKTGGLADVVGALPAALAGEGVETRVLLPGYPSVIGAITGRDIVREEADLFGGPASVRAARAGGLDLLVLDAPHLYDRPGAIYLGPDGRDWPDNPERFAALGWTAAALMADGAGCWRPDLVHCHDWQAALTPYYLREVRHLDTPAVLTLHNVAFQGLAPADRLERLRLDPAHFRPDGFEFWGRINALKAGILWSDAITTVSPTYAAELMRPEFGMGLEGVLDARRDALHGILNGIDEQAWNPRTDRAIHPYASPRGKARNRAALRAETGLPDAPGPLCVVVSRLSGQKGLDLLLEALPALLARGGQLALLGSGDAGLEAAWREAARHPDVAVRIGYDEAFSHRMIAGGDAILVPSRFEPCGLTQLYALRYGTVPLVTLTGGLADTVIHASPAALARGVATGLQIHPITAEALTLGLERLCDLFADPPTWQALQKNAMRQPVGWDHSAKAYAALYEGVKAAA